MQCKILRSLLGPLCAVTLVCVSCRQQMADQPRYEPYEQSSFFPDSLSARPLPEGVVSRVSLADVVQPPTTMDLLRQGLERFNIYCAPCHGYTGEGDGIVAVRGLRRPPPTFHSDRLRDVDAGHFYDVIENGFGAMPPYAYQVRPHERWAIAAYIRALQLSQWYDVADVPADERRRLEAETR
jgi:mono/diheme cytochrome c family protein